MRRTLTGFLLALVSAICFIAGSAPFIDVRATENYSNVPLRVETSADHITNYVTWYGNTERNDLPTKMFPELTDDFQEDTITALYSSFPDDLKDNMVLIVVGDGMANKASYDKMLNFYHPAFACQSLPSF